MSTISAGTTSTTTLIASGDTTGALLLKTNDTGSGGTTAMTIDTSQNVGIGTSSPLAKLGIIAAGDATFSSQVVIAPASGANPAKITFNPTVSSAIAGLSDGSVAFYGNGANTERMRIDSSGSLNLSGAYTEAVVAIGNSSTSKTLSLASGTFQTVTMTGNCTFTMPALVAGKSFNLIVNSGSGGFTGTFTSVKWPNNTAPTLTTTASRWDILAFECDGTYWYGAFQQAYQ